MSSKKSRLKPELFFSIFEHLREGIIIISKRGRVIYANHRFGQFFKLAIDRVEQMSAFELHQYMKANLEQESNVLNRIDSLNSAEERPLYDVLHFKNGTSLECTSILYHGKSGYHRVWLFNDISERVYAETSLYLEANYDALTGLPNRSLLVQRLNKAFHRAEQEADYGFALFFLDIDELKPINDSLGHVFGDQLLKETAHRLLQVSDRVQTKSLEAGDFVARLGGDEFILLLESKGGRDYTQEAERVMALLAEKIKLEKVEIPIKASIGIAIYNKSYENPEALLHAADKAMYEVKAGGRGAFKFSNQQ